MSEDDLLHVDRIKRERAPKEEKKEYRSIFTRPEIFLGIAGLSGALALMLRRGNRGHDL